MRSACRSFAAKRRRSGCRAASRSSIRTMSSRSSPSSSPPPIASRARAAQWRISRVEERARGARAARSPGPRERRRGCRRARLHAIRRRARRVSRRRLRRPDRAAGRAARARRAARRALAGALRARAGRRVPGHESGAVPAVPPARRPSDAVHRRRRRRPGDLRLARRDARQSRAASARLSRAQGDQARAELPLDDAHPALGERADRATIRSCSTSDCGASSVTATRCASRLRATKRRKRSSSPRGFARTGSSTGRDIPTTRFSIAAITRRACSRRRCARAGVPYEVSGGQSLFERTEIKDVVAYLRLIANDGDDPAFVRAVTTPKRGIGRRRWPALRSGAARGAEPVRCSVRCRSSRRRPAYGSAKTLDAFCASINGCAIAPSASRRDDC